MLDLLQLLQLSDSALPIGSSAHSFGLETLTAEGDLTPTDLEAFFADLLIETGPLEGAYCCAAYRLAQGYAAGRHGDEGEELNRDFEPDWWELNLSLSARKPARESREASTTLGKRFLRLVTSLESVSMFQRALQTPMKMEHPTTARPIHHCTAFGLVGGALNLGEEAVVSAYLQQSLTGLLSACQRLMPVGQMQAISLGWTLKPLITRIAAQSQTTDWRTVHSFSPVLDLAGMRHANLPVRLFIS